MVEEKVVHIPASIDFTKVPKGLQGKWIVVNKNSHEFLGSGDSPQEAMDDATVSASTKDIVLTRVPVEYGPQRPLEPQREERDG